MRDGLDMSAVAKHRLGARKREDRCVDIRLDARSHQRSSVDVTTPAVPCDNFDGTPLSTSDLDGGIGGQIVGNPLQGAQAGDRVMAPGVNETLCFRVSLPLSTGNAFQAATTTATFTFDAEQTSNNP